MRKVVFLDRDGVINDDTGHYYVFKKEDFKLNKGVLESIALAKQKGYDIIIISNQGGIARGTYSKHNVELVHDRLKELFLAVNVEPLAIYYCPHHDEIESCLCRKPSGLMIKKALARFHVDVKKSFMIGDSVRDVQAAQNAGIKGYKIDANQNFLPLISQLLNG